MSKADRARKRRAKSKKKITLPEVAKVPRPKKRGRARMAERQDEGADRLVLAARAAKMGKGKSEMAGMRDSMLGEDAGRAIALGCGGDEARQLWQVYCDFTASERQYARCVLGRGLDPKTQKVEMMPERIEARADDRPDLRTEEERERDATSAWMRWRGYIGQLASGEQSALFDIVRARREAVDGGELTAPGQRFVAAMRKLRNVVDRAQGTP